MVYSYHKNKMIERYYINNNDENEHRGEKNKSKFLIKKDNTLKSLREVEFFLENWKKAIKGIRLYKILK